MMQRQAMTRLPALPPPGRVLAARPVAALTTPTNRHSNPSSKSRSIHSPALALDVTPIPELGAPATWAEVLTNQIVSWFVAQRDPRSAGGSKAPGRGGGKNDRERRGGARCGPGGCRAMVGNVLLYAQSQSGHARAGHGPGQRPSVRVAPRPPPIPSIPLPPSRARRLDPDMPPELVQYIKQEQHGHVMKHAGWGHSHIADRLVCPARPWAAGNSLQEQ